MSYIAKRNLLEEILDDFGTESEDFLRWIYDLLFGLDEDEIPTDELIEGSGEKQLDVIRVEDDVENRKAHIHIVQAKKTSGFAANVVVLIANGLSTVLETKKADVAKLKNKVLSEKILEIRDLLKTYGYGSVELSIYFATLGNTEDTGQEIHEATEKLKGKANSFGFAEFNFHLLGAAELYDLWFEKFNADRRINQDINIIYDVNRASIIEYMAEGYKAVVCTISGEEVARLASLEPKDAIFDMNVRGHLGLGGRVNSSILRAAQIESEAKTFWFKNNGITMVCKKLDVNKDPDEPVVKVQNVQIINGCQTSVTLREVHKAGKLQDSVRLLAKIFQIDDSSLISKIVLATNNQNSIVSRDLYANDECQMLIQQTVATKLGLFYERKRGEARANGRTRSETIDSEKAGQAYLAIKKKQPTTSRAQKYKIYDTDLYVEIFEKSSPLQLALCYSLYEYCKKRGLKEAKKLERGDDTHSLLTYGVFHLARAFSYFVFKSEELPANEETLIAVTSKLRNNDKSLNAPFNKAKKLCSRVLKKAKVASANNYFKAQQAQQQITDEIHKV